MHSKYNDATIFGKIARDISRGGHRGVENELNLNSDYKGEDNLINMMVGLGLTVMGSTLFPCCVTVLTRRRGFLCAFHVAFTRCAIVNAALVSLGRVMGLSTTYLVMGLSAT